MPVFPCVYHRYWYRLRTHAEMTLAITLLSLCAVWCCRAALCDLEPHFVDAGLPTAGGVQAREFKTGSVSGFAKLQQANSQA